MYTINNGHPVVSIIHIIIRCPTDSNSNSGGAAVVTARPKGKIYCNIFFKYFYTHTQSTVRVLIAHGYFDCVSCSPCR